MGYLRFALITDGGVRMFDEIEELVQAIDKFKANIVNSNEIIDSLKSTNDRFDELFSNREKDKGFVNESLAEISQLIEKQTTDLKFEFSTIAESINGINLHLREMEKRVAIIDLCIEKNGKKQEKSTLYQIIGAVTVVILIIILKFI